MCVSDVYLTSQAETLPAMAPGVPSWWNDPIPTERPKARGGRYDQPPDIFRQRATTDRRHKAAGEGQCARRLGVVMSFVLPTVFTRLRWSNIPYFGCEIGGLERRFKRENKVIGTQQILLLIKRASPFKNINSKNKF